jgi:hypothetical protein
MASRRLPRSVNDYLDAFRAAKSKADAIGDVSLLAFSASTLARLEIFLPNFENEVNERKVALVNQTNATGEKNLAFDKAAMYASQFFQVFNFGVFRGVFHETDRPYYGIDVNDSNTPAINSDSDLLLWGQNLIDGETARVAAAGVVMNMPSAAEFTIEFDKFKVQQSAQSALKDQYDKEQEDVSALLDDANLLAKDIWDEVEFHFRHDDAASKRRKCREYGVVYVNDNNEEIIDPVEPVVE